MGEGDGVEEDGDGEGVSEGFEREDEEKDSEEIEDIGRVGGKSISPPAYSRFLIFRMTDFLRVRPFFPLSFFLSSFNLKKKSK